jgi:hypothetical protein
VVIQYEERLRQLQAGIEQLRLLQALATTALTIAVALFLALSLYAVRGQVSFLWSSLPIPIAAASARRLQRQRKSKSQYWRLNRFYDRAIRRVKGDWKRSEAAGEIFNDPDHAYAQDLNIFGEGSLFQLLNIARTSIGQQGLANYLLKAPALEETLLRQEAVRELRGRIDLREKIATLGEFEFTESTWSTFEDWLNSPALSFPRYLPITAAITSGLVAGLLLAGHATLIPWAVAAILIGTLMAFHAGVGLVFRNRVNRLVEWVRPVFCETGVLREGLDLLAREQFQSVKLRRLADRVRNGPAKIRKLERLLDAFGQRDKEWFYLFSRLLLAGTQLCIAIEQWRAEHGQALKTWLEAWGEFEALSALAAYGFENPENTFPELTVDEICFEAQELGHPSLPRSFCVTNDVELRDACRFYVVSGSNMSGKSTLLRSIGTNAVLGFAGAPVRARAFRMSGLSIFASLSIVDSVQNGKSKFLAEVERLRMAIETAASKPVLFLVDEIFSGTNSRDRRMAAEAVVRTLIDRGAIGVVSTHDLALTEIANDYAMHGVNVHMGSRDGRDPLDFDYRLKPGVTNETNALAIARMAGVPV